MINLSVLISKIAFLHDSAYDVPRVTQHRRTLFFQQGRYHNFMVSDLFTPWICHYQALIFCLSQASWKWSSKKWFEETHTYLVLLQWQHDHSSSPVLLDSSWTMHRCCTRWRETHTDCLCDHLKLLLPLLLPHQCCTTTMLIENLKQSWLPAFWKKIQNTQEIKRTLFNKTEQDKTCKLFM